MGIIYGLKVNLHVAIVSMVNYTAIGGDNLHTKSNSSACFDTNEDKTNNLARKEVNMVFHVNKTSKFSCYFNSRMVHSIGRAAFKECY